MNTTVQTNAPIAIDLESTNAMTARTDARNADGALKVKFMMKIRPIKKKKLITIRVTEKEFNDLPRIVKDRAYRDKADKVIVEDL